MKLFSAKTKQMMGRIAYICLWVLMLSGSIIALAFVNKQEEEITCNKINISVEPRNVHFFNRQKVLETIRLDANETRILRTPMSEIRTGALEKKLINNRQIEKAKVYSDLKGTLNIKVKQRVPVLRIMRYDGREFYMDKNGIKLPLSTDFTAHVPLANGNISERPEKGDSVYSFVGQQLYKIATYVDNDAFWKAQIEQIFVTGESEFILIPKIGDHIILLGSADELDEKFNKLLVFYKEGLNRLGWSTYRSINLKFRDQIVCERKD